MCYRGCPQNKYLFSLSTYCAELITDIAPNVDQRAGHGKEALHWRLAINAIISVKKRGTECGGNENTSEAPCLGEVRVPFIVHVEGQLASGASHRRLG
jgi:hypothetical protein